MNPKYCHPKESEGSGVCRRSSSRPAFTMPELLVVMGIILIFIALAVPAFNALSGTRSIAGAENNLTAVLLRAREEAIGLQEIRGILFTLDPKTDRVMALIVRKTDGPLTGSYAIRTDIVWLDLVPDRDSLLLPPGVRLQTAFDGTYMNINERYLGYQKPPLGDNGAKIGGVILFDGSGRLVVRPYGFRLMRVDQSSGTTVATGISDLLYLQAGASEVNDAQNNDPYIPFYSTPAAPGTAAPLSQAGIVLFDKKDFDAGGFIDDDLQSNEVPKETWIDTNATPILINRYTGGMIRGE